MPNPLELFSTNLKNVLTRALSFGIEQGLSHIHPPVLFWALASQKSCVGYELLKKSGVKPAAIKAFGETFSSTSTLTQPELDPHTRRVFEKATLIAQMYHHHYVGTEHLLAALLQLPHVAIEMFFSDHAIDVEKLKNHVLLILKSTSQFPHLSAETNTSSSVDLSKAEQESSSSTKQALEYFGEELTACDLANDLDPVIEREQEIERVMQILCRRTKNNPLLLGKAGVGKTAIVEGLAKKIAEGSVPAPLAHVRIISIDLASMLAGTMYRGEFEGRLKQLIDEASDNKNIVLFIDEIHMIVGAGSATGSMDAANVLKPALARGDLRCIGATTPEEYKKHLESDRALKRRLQVVNIEEPSREKAKRILLGIAPYYETFHGVRMSKDLIDRAVDLTCEFIPGAILPDQAIDILDEAAASVRLAKNQLGQREQEALLEKQLEALKEKKRLAVIEESFTDALEMKMREEQLLAELEDPKKRPSLPTLTLGTSDIGAIVARVAGIHLDDVLGHTQTRTKRLKKTLIDAVTGQAPVIETVTNALVRSRAGIGSNKRPRASFLFAGPTGVGKTLLAKTLARALFGDEKQRLIRLDMSAFKEGFSVSKLIGAPAGYVGYREASQLTDRLKHTPQCVVLFDELEKAHPDVSQLLLQILEEGELTDATGETISFAQTVIVGTVSHTLTHQSGLGFEETDTLQTRVTSHLEDLLRSELVNRFDHVCSFAPLDQEALKTIIHTHLAQTVERLKTKGIAVSFEDSLVDWVVTHMDSKTGARDVRRMIETHIETPLAHRLLGKKSQTHLHLSPDQHRIRATGR